MTDLIFFFFVSNPCVESPSISNTIVESKYEKTYLTVSKRYFFKRKSILLGTNTSTLVLKSTIRIVRVSAASLVYPVSLSPKNRKQEVLPPKTL